MATIRSTQRPFGNGGTRVAATFERECEACACCLEVLPTRVVLRSLASRLKQFNRVARWIIEENLRAARARYDVVAEVDSGRTESLDFRGKVVDDEVNTVPATRGGLAAIGHRPPR